VEHFAGTDGWRGCGGPGGKHFAQTSIEGYPPGGIRVSPYFNPKPYYLTIISAGKC